jgi:hypothetical protein
MVMAIAGKNFKNFSLVKVGIPFNRATFKPDYPACYYSNGREVQLIQ